MAAAAIGAIVFIVLYLRHRRQSLLDAVRDVEVQRHRDAQRNSGGFLKTGNRNSLRVNPYYGTADAAPMAPVVDL